MVVKKHKNHLGTDTERLYFVYPQKIKQECVYAICQLFTQHGDLGDSIF